MRLTVIFLLLFLGCSLQEDNNSSYLPNVNGVWKFTNTYGGMKEDIAHGVTTTADGGFIVVGNTQSTDGDFFEKTREGSDIFLMKFDAFEQHEWTKTYGGSGDDRGYDVVQLPDQGYALIGYSNSNDGDATNNEGQHDNWLIRTDAKGTLLWQKSFGFLGHDHAYNIITTADGGLFFNGYLDVTASNGAGQDGKQIRQQQKHGVGEFWCHKVDASGNLEWRRYFGGTSNDRSYDAIETRDGHFILAGTSESQDVDVSDPKGGYDIWILKLDEKGNLIWEKSIGGSLYDGAQAVVEQSNGNYLVLGQTYSRDGDIQFPRGSSDVLLAELSPDGTLLSAHSYGTPEFETANDMILRPDGTLVVVGHSSPQNITPDQSPMSNDVQLYYLLKENTIRKYQLSGSGLDVGHHLAMQSDGSVIVVGSTTSSDGDFQNTKGDADIFIAIWY